MPEVEMNAAAQGAGNNSSDFVRKLYKMLEDPAYSEVVRWGNEGNSFVVLENEKFTKTILPKHFKHSNFASFVRQLNKYDFHKVRHNEESGQSPYGTSAWEFKHPEFRVDKKDNLDNIRRKAPAPRKAQNNEEHFGVANQQVVVLGETLAATQQQVQQLQESYYEIVNANKIFVDEILHLQKLVRAQNQVSNELINHLNKVEQERKDSRTSNHSTPAYNSGNANLLSDGSESPLELRRARDIMNTLSIDHVADRDLNRMSIAFHQPGGSPESAGSQIMGPPSAAGVAPFLHDPLTDMRHLVYPVGQTIGIDPFAPEHMNNIPYNRPGQDNPMTSAAELNAPPISHTPPANASQGPVWGQKKPHVLLVEDDKTCSRIGSKFLMQYDCGVEVARDGLEAVNKVNARQHQYDLIFMDIVMPQLDGVSATAMIREVQPNTPIIAMTSNINQQDLEMYFHWGMRDVLAKPFTKEGMIGKIRKHLIHLMRNPPPESMMEPIFPNGAPNQPPTPGPYPNQGVGMAPLSATSSGPVAKFDTTPIQSPATSTSWHSPGQVPHASPTIPQDQGYLSAGSGSQMVLTPGGTQKPQYANAMMPQMGAPRMPDSMHRPDGPPEKRQRLYGPQPHYNQ
ncbi:HSF-type DNA-binding-domain-containing protein [Xylariomycetidae sp. FL2044]|nr:HSF-type DNA-binding-domain-containing protein [Xylariomycetidae sp. FL2044]